MTIIEELEKEQVAKLTADGSPPWFAPGDTLKVKVKVVEGTRERVQAFEGVCIAVIHRTDDDDDKLVVVPWDQAYDDEQIRALTAFQERFFTSVILRKP